MSRLFATDMELSDAEDSAEPQQSVANDPAPMPNMEDAVPGSVLGSQQTDRAFAQVPGTQPVGGQVIRPRSFSDSGRRPAVLVPLYASFAALQVLDATSTLKALKAGGREVNPLGRAS